MRVMVFGKATEDSGKGAPPTAEAFAAMDRFIGELVKAGVFVAAAGLQNNAPAKRVVLGWPRPPVIDGRWRRLIPEPLRPGGVTP